ncbi:MAG: hypothetical protein RR641_03065, partial [Erysipelotrichaceae bacterium]
HKPKKNDSKRVINQLNILSFTRLTSQAIIIIYLYDLLGDDIFSFLPDKLLEIQSKKRQS